MGKDDRFLVMFTSDNVTYKIWSGILRDYHAIFQVILKVKNLLRLLRGLSIRFGPNLIKFSHVINEIAPSLLYFVTNSDTNVSKRDPRAMQFIYVNDQMLNKIEK